MVMWTRAAPRGLAEVKVHQESENHESRGRSQLDIKRSTKPRTPIFSWGRSRLSAEDREVEGKTYGSDFRRDSIWESKELIRLEEGIRAIL
jgi:hypothetical protein